MNNQIKEEGLTDAYLLGKHDGIKQGRADAIDECLHLIEDTPWRDIWMLIDTIKELKEQK